MAKKKLKLKMNKDYNIKLIVAPYQRNVRLNAKYLGHGNKWPDLTIHVFALKDKNKETEYCFLDESWIEIERGIIIHPYHVPDFRCGCYTESYFKERLTEAIAENDPRIAPHVKHDSDLLKILRQIGEQI